jgi:hypothetical protein
MFGLGRFGYNPPPRSILWIFKNIDSRAIKVWQNGAIMLQTKEE